MALLPPSATPLARRLVQARAARGFADGLVSVLLAIHLTALGFSPLRVGAIVTGTLLGSAVLTLWTGLVAHRLAVHSVLVAASVLMCATGLGFAALRSFWPLLLVAVVGTLNPSGGDVSVFLPIEQSVLAGEVDDAERPALYAAYNLAGALAAAVGALASGLPAVIDRATDLDRLLLQRLGFVLYAMVAVGVGLAYRRLPDAATPTNADPGRRPLERSRRTVLELAALFSLDSAGGGFAVTSILVLWLHLRHDLSSGATAATFFAASVLAGLSALLSGPIARRIGLVRTMVFTHLPANGFLVLSALAPDVGLAVALLLLRALLSQMDVPVRQAFVMQIVPPEERAAAASVTNVPRSLASAATPLVAGYLLSRTTFGWPLVIGGAMKALYDVLLLVLYRGVPEEVGALRVRARPRT